MRGLKLSEFKAAVRLSNGAKALVGPIYGRDI
jgi:hypothetical protein